MFYKQQPMEPIKTLHYSAEHPRTVVPWALASLACFGISVVLCVVYVIMSSERRETWDWEMQGTAAMFRKISPLDRIPYLLWPFPVASLCLFLLAAARRQCRAIGGLLMFSLVAVIAAFACIFVAKSLRIEFLWSTLRGD